MTVLFVGKRKLEPGGGDTPSHFDRLRWWGGKGAVEAKCEGCERSRIARWSWHGGGEGLPGVSSQDGALSTPLRTGRSIKQTDRLALYRHHCGHKPGHRSRQAKDDGLAYHHHKTNK